MRTVKHQCGKNVNQKYIGLVIQANPMVYERAVSCYGGGDWRLRQVEAIRMKMIIG